MQRYNRLIVSAVCLCVLVAALLSVSAVSIAQSNPSPTPTVAGQSAPPGLSGLPGSSVRGELAGSAADLRIDVNPLLGINVAAPTYSPSFYESNVVAGGDTAIDAAGSCLGGYTTPQATLGLVWVEDLGAVDIQFVPTKQRGKPVSLMLWDLMNAQWWCTPTAAENNMLSFSNMSKGVYFIWVVTQDANPVTGIISVVGPPPGN